MSTIIKILFLTNKEEDHIFLNNKNSIHTINRNVSIVLSVIGILTFSLLSFISFKSESYFDLRESYLILLSICCISLIILKFNFNIIPPTVLLYLVFTVLILYASFTSSFLTPESTCVIILAFLFEFPIITLDKSIRVNLIEIIYAATYLVIISFAKDRSIFIDEIINVTIFTLTALLLGQYLRKTRLEHIEYQRLSIIRETTDPLTNLYNRRKLYASIEEIEKVNPTYEAISVALLDIDQFKLYNDVYGHQLGDECLVSVCNCFRKLAKEFPITFYRFGGEEFIAIIK